MKIIFHNIRSAHNVGSLFRTADGAGVKKIYLSGYTPAPVDRFGRKRARIAKVALGAEESVSWEKHEDITDLISLLKKEGSTIVAVEQDKRSVNYKEYTPQTNSVFVFGNEVEGLSKEIIDKADVVIEIPMHGSKESLNVSVAAGIILFEFA